MEKNILFKSIHRLKFKYTDKERTIILQLVMKYLV